MKIVLRKIQQAKSQDINIYGKKTQPTNQRQTREQS